MCDTSDIDECPEVGTVRRGDLLLCVRHAAGIPWNVGRVEGEVRCSCGGFRPTSQRYCGEPCDY